jgi:folate-binding protein YgfZ
MTATTTPPALLPALNGVARLTHLGVIHIEGDDAAKFIHGQLTQDFSLLDQHSARLAAFCNAKGRMQASFVGFKRPDGAILLICSRDILATTLKRLSMFVMRAKAKLTDATNKFAVYGLSGSAIKNIAGYADSTWVKADFGAQTVVNLYPAGDTPRQLCVAPVEADAPAGVAMDLALWQWSEVQSGVATLTQPVFEAFVPQMLNYESIGGVNFKKGCYPGQEVVARSQFRGTLKRRTFLVHSEAAMQAGDEVFSVAEPDQPAGTVVQAAQAPGGGWDALISLQLSAVDAGALTLGAATGPAIALLPLPYPLLEDI